MMFVGMILCLGIYAIKVAAASNKTPEEDAETEPFVTKGGKTYQTLQESRPKEPPPPSFMKTFFLIAVPAVADLVATLLCNVGLQWIPSSIWQMLRGAMVVFSALLSIAFLNKKLYLFNWVGILSVMSALALVGVACVHESPPPGQEEGGYQVFGVVLVILAQLVQASQIVIEEFLLKSVKADPFLIVGLEGFWGLLITSFIFLPLFQNVQLKGFTENTVESLYMVFHNSSIAGTILIYTLVIMGLNFTGMMVTQQFTAVHRTILEAARTGCIWVANLIIYYYISDNFGEVWSDWSYLQLLGFCLLLVGLFIYNQVIELRCLPDHKLVQESQQQLKKEPAQLPSRVNRLKQPPGSPFVGSPRI